AWTLKLDRELKKRDDRFGTMQLRRDITNMNVLGTKTRAICILGMHRSGTSAIARAINLLGAYLGEEDDVSAYGPDNPEGFWESLELRSFNDRLLYQLNKSWDTALPLEEQWHLREEIRPLRNELRELIKKKFSGRNLWAWKDPRTSVLFPLWKDVLKELDMELLCVFAVRNPLDVVKSLEKRDGFSHDKGFAIWFNYNISALSSILNVPTVFVSYDKFLNNWESELRRCAETLKISWPEDDTPLRNKMNLFIRPDLRHSASTVADLTKMDTLGPVVELYELLLNLCEETKISDPQFLTPVDRLSKEFIECERFFRCDITEAFENSLKCQLLEKEQQLQERTAWALKLERERKERDDRLGTLQREFEERTEWALKLEKELKEQTEWALKLEKERKERTEWALKVERECKERDDRLGTLQREFEERTEWALKLDSELKERDDRLGTLQMEYEERTEWASKLDSELKERDDRLGILQMEYEERTEWALKLDSELKERDDRLGTLQMEYEERTEWALKLEKELKEREERLRLVEDSLRKQCDEIGENNKQLKEKDLELAEQVRALDTSCRLRENESLMFEEKLRQNEKLIREYVNSISWKITAPLRFGYGLLRKLVRRI
ncbi:MAG: hypothetical protein ABSB95_02310, partial [Dissulfurispiraceae bacterium]